MPSKKTAAVQFIFITILLDALGIGLLIPVFPDIIRRFNPDPQFVSQYFGFFISVYALMQFLASPILGSLSDRFGRRPVLLVSLLGAGLDYILMGFAPSLSILFFGRVIAGLSGASMTVASSYMADISNDKNRSANFGLIGAAFGLGFIMGPALGGVVSKFGSTTPFLVAAALNLLNFVFGLFVLPESLPENIRRKIELKRLNPFASLLRVFRMPGIAVFLLVYALYNMAGQSHPSIWTLYTEHKFKWTSFEVGLSLSFVGISVAISQGVLTRVLIPRLGEYRSLIYGIAISVVSFAAFAFATQGWMMYAIVSFFAISGIAGPALQSLISKDVPSQEQGEVQGSLISIASLTAIGGPIIYTSLFAQFTKEGLEVEFPGMPYVMASVICILALVLLVAKRPRENELIRDGVAPKEYYEKV